MIGFIRRSSCIRFDSMCAGEHDWRTSIVRSSSSSCSSS